MWYFQWWDHISIAFRLEACQFANMEAIAALAVGAALPVLMDLAGKLLGYIADGWYTASQNTKNFGIEVKRLTKVQEAWSNRLERYGMSDNVFVKDTMEEAKKLLEEQISRVQKRQRGFAGRRLIRLTFPTDVTAKLTMIANAFDDIEKSLADDERLGQLVGNAGLRGVADLPFISESKYVSLEGTVRDLRAALENVETPMNKVVILYGASGLGKSSMARYLALLYRHGVPMPASENNPGRALESWFRHGVIFLHCGPGAVYSSLLVQLWEKLGFESLGSTPDVQSSSQSNSMSGIKIKEQMRGLLKEQKLLIILDDVRDGCLVEQMLMQREGIKYLITAHNANVWRDAEPIRMEKPNLQEARKIVSNHVKGFRGNVPENLQGVVDEIIAKCDHDPFDLANVAAKIRREYAHEPAEWASIQRSLRSARDGDPNHPPVLYGRAYSKRTKFIAMELLMDSFRAELLTFLFTATICQGQYWVPEVVFKVFFECMHWSLACFWDCKLDLTSSDVIKIQREQVGWSDIPLETMAIHDRYREYILTKKKEELDRMVRQLLGQGSTIDSHQTSLCVLLVLYGQKDWREEAAKRLHVAVDDDLSKLVEPFVWLFHAGGQEEWQNRSHQLATEVILHCLRSGEIHDSAMAELLTLQETAEATRGALHSMALLNENAGDVEMKWLLTGTHNRTMSKIVEFLRNDNPAEMRLGILETLNRLIFPYQCHWGIRDTSGQSLVPLVLAKPLGWFVILLEGKSDQSRSLVNRMQSISIKILGLLAMGSLTDKRIVEMLLPEMWSSLLNLIGGDVQLSVQRSVIQFLGRFFSRGPFDSEGNSESFSSIPDSVVRVLVRLALGKETSVNYLEAAAWYALGNFVSFSVENQVKVGSVSGLLDGVVSRLADHGSTDMVISRAAAYLLGGLCSSHNGICIASFPGLLAGLGRLLTSHIDQRISLHAARTIGRMTTKEDEDPIRIWSTPGVVEGLVGLLEGEAPSWKGAWVMRALSRFLSLWSVPAAEVELEKIQAHVREAVLAAPNAVDGLVDLTSAKAPQGPLNVTERRQVVAAAELLTLVDVGMANETILRSSWAHAGRGRAKACLRLYSDALQDLDVALGDARINDRAILLPLFRLRGFARAMIDDHNGALEDASKCIDLDRGNPYNWLERAVLRKMMKLWQQALDDMDKSSSVMVHNIGNYHILKHRGHVKFLQGDQDGATLDAKMATELKQLSYENYGNVYTPSLGRQRITYLEFEL